MNLLYGPTHNMCLYKTKETIIGISFFKKEQERNKIEVRSSAP